MAALLNMVKQNVTSVASSGLGVLTLGAAISGYRTYTDAGAVTGRTYSYSILEGTKFEHGHGIYTASGPFLSRNLVLGSSASNGSYEVFTSAAILTCTVLAQDISEDRVVNYGTVGGGNLTWDWSQGPQQAINGGAHTWVFNNFPLNNFYGELQVFMINAGAFPITMPTIQWVRGDGTYSTTFSTLGVTLQPTGINLFIFWTLDGGINIFGRAA